jgi:DNA-binding MarR family transcriptional regulator
MAKLPQFPDHVKSTYMAYASMMDRVNSIGRLHGLNSTAVLIIAFIGDRLMAPRDILANEMTGASNISYNLNILTERDLITRTSYSRDKRIQFVKLTDAGLSLCGKIRRELALEGRMAA